MEEMKIIFRQVLARASFSQPLLSSTKENWVILKYLFLVKPRAY